ncbi:hypothetical protein llap_10434 [Limosa lapponica baueri]|uniref:Uncharacterized protein n=1 Tax=Limosa lapponica baueri TaxID=1758121 RepID=A0A2I0TZZ8_LIMLA|nr:hypothetical protein llap_10434 [Limosa lapponica baueri]
MLKTTSWNVKILIFGKIKELLCEMKNVTVFGGQVSAGYHQKQDIELTSFLVLPGVLLYNSFLSCGIGPMLRLITSFCWWLCFTMRRCARELGTAEGKGSNVSRQSMKNEIHGSSSSSQEDHEVRKTYVLQIVEDPEHAQEHFTVNSKLKMTAQQDIGNNRDIANQKCMCVFIKLSLAGLGFGVEIPSGNQAHDLLDHFQKKIGTGFLRHHKDSFFHTLFTQTVWLSILFEVCLQPYWRSFGVLWVLDCCCSYISFTADFLCDLGEVILDAVSKSTVESCQLFGALLLLAAVSVHVPLAERGGALVSVNSDGISGRTNAGPNWSSLWMNLKSRLVLSAKVMS